MYLPFSIMEKCLEQGLEQDLEMYLATPHIMRGELPQGISGNSGKMAETGHDRISGKKPGSFCGIKKRGAGRQMCAGSQHVYLE